MLESVIKMMFRHKSIEARRREAHLAEIKNLITKGNEDPESANPAYALMGTAYEDPDNTTSKKVNSADRAEIVADLNPAEKPYVVDKMVLAVPESYKEGDKLCFKQVDTPNETCKQNAWLKSTVSTIHIPKDSYTEYVEG